MKNSSKYLAVRFSAVISLIIIILLAGAFPWSQKSIGPLVMAATNGATGNAGSAASMRSHSVNKYFTYPGIELWDSDNWVQPKALPIAAWIELHQKSKPAEYEVPAKYKGIKDFVGNPDYTWQTDSIKDPAITNALQQQGLNVSIREGGGIQVVVAPEKVLTDKEHKVPVVIVPYRIDNWDVFWAMNTLEHFKKYNELCAQRSDFILDYYVVDKTLAGVGQSISANAGALTDPTRVYLDVSAFAEIGAKIADVPKLNWSDDNGTKSDPDAAIEHIGSIPVLNIAGKRSGGPSFSLGPRYRGQFPGIEVPFDAELIEHGVLGMHWMEGIRFAHDHGLDNDPAIKAHFDEMGLVYSDNDFRGKRYLVFSPKVAVEKKIQLPLVIINSDASHSNQYSISQTYAEYLDYFKLAASGQLNILTLSLGSVDDIIDRDYNLIKEAEKNAPIDPSRVYVTGHSHMGFESREFAYRHPDMIAAAAPLGNGTGYAAPSYSHESIKADDPRIEAWSKIDMPLITLGAVGEELSPHTTPALIMPDYNLFIEAWQRRLKASRAPMKTREQIMAAEHSDDYVTRLYGLPNDGSSLQVIDGVDHYIIDVKNIDGKDHMRFVAIDNMFHTTEPTMPTLAWTFMSRFARDQKTGKVIELY